MDAFITHKGINALKAYRKSIVAATIVTTIMGIFAGCEEPYTPARKEPFNVSTATSAEIAALSEQIKQSVKQLEYSDQVAEDFVTMVMGWKDPQGEPVLIAWKQKLTQVKEHHNQASISEDHLAKTEESITTELSIRIKKEISYKHELYDLGDVVKNKQSQCLGYSQVFYILGTSVGLSANATNVVEPKTGSLLRGMAHTAIVVTLADGKTMMVDLDPRGFVSRPFMLEEKFAKIGDYWEIKDKDNPLGTHRRIQVLDRNGLIACIHNERGIAYHKLGRYSKATSDFAKAIELHPKLVQPYTNRAVSYCKLGQFSDAISDCTKAIELNPKSADAYFNRGVAYARLGQYSEAVSDYTKVIELNPRDADAYYNRGVYYGNLGQLPQAISDYTKAIELNPKLAEAYSNRGVAYADLGKPEEAKKDLLKAVKLNPALKPHVKGISDHFKLGLKLD